MKLGLGQSYDAVQYLPVKLRAYLDLTKPASTLGVAGGYLMASLLFFYYTGQPEHISTEFRTIIHVVVTMACAHGASQAMNMAEDAEMDRNTPHKQNRPIPSGVVSEEEARSIAWILAAFALGRAFLITPVFGILVMVLLGFGVFYNLDPIRAKERIISIPWQAVSRGLLLFPTVWAAYGSVLAVEAWILGIFLFFYVAGFQNSADIIDKEVDEEYGIQTFAVVLGVDGVVRVAAGCLSAMIAVILLSIQGGLLSYSLGSVLFITPFCLFMVYHMQYNPETIDDRTGNHPAWLWFYIGMVLTVAIPLSVEIIIQYNLV